MNVFAPLKFASMWIGSRTIRSATYERAGAARVGCISRNRCSEQSTDPISSPLAAEEKL